MTDTTAIRYKSIVDTNFRERLEELFSADHGAQSRIARIADMAQGQLSKLVSSKQPAIQTVFRIAIAAGVSPGWLAFGEGLPPTLAGTATAESALARAKAGVGALRAAVVAAATPPVPVGTRVEASTAPPSKSLPAKGADGSAAEARVEIEASTTEPVREADTSGSDVQTTGSVATPTPPKESKSATVSLPFAHRLEPDAGGAADEQRETDSREAKEPTKVVATGVAEPPPADPKLAALQALMDKTAAKYDPAGRKLRTVARPAPGATIPTIFGVAAGGGSPVELDMSAEAAEKADHWWVVVTGASENLRRAAEAIAKSG